MFLQVNHNILLKLVNNIFFSQVGTIFSNEDKLHVDFFYHDIGTNFSPLLVMTTNI
jgi:hypothetical protein